MTEHIVRNNFNLESINYHINLIQDYIKDKPKDKENQFKSELYILETYPEFYNDYPFLVKKICKNDDITMIYTMITQLNKIQNGEDTLSNVELNLGKKLANEYLYPNI